MNTPLISKDTISKSRSAITKEIVAMLTGKDKNPSKTLSSGRIMAKAWAKQIEEDKRLIAVQSFMHNVMSSYWRSVQASLSEPFLLQAHFQNISFIELDESIEAVANVIGKTAAELDVISASYELGNLYTGILPEKLRSENGVFYTPPVLTKRLLDLVENAGIDWATAKVADPACGGGAFLAPVAQQIVEKIGYLSAEEQLQHIENHLRGYEIDPFSGWLTQVFLQVALKDVMRAAGRNIKALVTICDTLEHYKGHQNKYDLVIGNPPYGKVKLTDDMRKEYGASLYGHPNLYGLFTHLAINLVKPGGIVGYLTPTSFLSGEYFKNLRLFIRQKTTPLAVDFVAVRKGVFEDVLQETMLAAYRKKQDASLSGADVVQVNEIQTLTNGKLKVGSIGNYKLSADLSAPWILPRHISQAKIVGSMSGMTEGLNSWGYKISTGQLVWNRHKDQLSDKRSKLCYPIIWAEAVSREGSFQFKAEKKNHKSWFKFKEGNNFLLTKTSCILLQRTTSKEQEKRLITTVLPDQILQEHGSVIIENHLNMIIPVVPSPAVDLRILSVFLNSKAVNDAFRTISGSVAVSAYELESLPLPPIADLKRLNKLINENAAPVLIEKECLKLYTKTN